MPKPPAWIPYLGPVAAGVTAGLAAPHIAGVWLLIVVATVVGFVPIVVYRLWKWRHHREG